MSFVACKALPTVQTTIDIIDKYFEPTYDPLPSPAGIMHPSIFCSHAEKKVFMLHDQLIKLWALGEYLLAPQLQNAAIKYFAQLIRLREKLCFDIPLHTIELAFEITAKNSAICNMLATEMVYDWKQDLYQDTNDVGQLEMIPGFFTLFLAKLQECPDKKCVHETKCHLLKGAALAGKYMVSED